MKYVDQNGTPRFAVVLVRPDGTHFELPPGTWKSCRIADEYLKVRAETLPKIEDCLARMEVERSAPARESVNDPRMTYDQRAELVA